MRFISALPALLALVPAIFATPVDIAEDLNNARSAHFPAACSLRHVTLPSQGLQNFTPIRGDSRHPKAVVLGVGVQNYTCGSTGTFTNVGAVATLFDISCLIDQPILSELASLAVAADLENQSLFSTQALLDYAIGHHYFVKFNNTLSPRFDVTHAVHPNIFQFIIGKKLKNVAAPGTAHNVDLLQVGAVDGKFSHTVYRLSTAGGQPPASCKPGSPEIQVKYAAQYWYFAED